jgi:excisionase family DNA binding protein
VTRLTTTPCRDLSNRLSLGVLEAASVLGVSRPTIYRLIARGELPIFKLGSRTLILRTDLENLLAKLVQRAA